ncbi:MAG: hypothetical protein WD646_05340 [Actinomycetota bacterium]
MQERWWVWVALAGVLFGAAFLALAWRKIAATFPEDVRAAARDAIRKRPRMVAIAGVVAAWTLVYALYSMSLPAGIVRAGEEIPPDVSGAQLAQEEGDVGSASAPSGDAVTGAAPTGTSFGPGEGEGGVIGPPPGGGGEPQAPCSVEAQADAIRQAQMAAEALTGRPLGTDASILIEAIGGCGDPASAALALLGPIDQLISDLGIIPDTIPLPDLPSADLPTVPEAIAAPLRPYVFDVCAQASAQLVTVGALAPFFHLDYDQFVETLSVVDKICGTFAPATPFMERSEGAP